MHPKAEEELMVRLKLVVLEFADHLGVTKACREFEVPRSSFYRWKQKYEKAGQSGLYRERPVAYRHPRRTRDQAMERLGIKSRNAFKHLAKKYPDYFVLVQEMSTRFPRYNKVAVD